MEDKKFIRVIYDGKTDKPISVHEFEDIVRFDTSTHYMVVYQEINSYKQYYKPKEQN